VYSVDFEAGTYTWSCIKWSSTVYKTAYHLLQYISKNVRPDCIR